jgi:hypothetical protein
MLNLVPALLAAAIYVGFQKYYVKRNLSNTKLAWEASTFAFVTHLIMYAYRYYMGFEGMTTFGDKCPNGHKMVSDPMNKDQSTCVPVGHQTESPLAGIKTNSK